MKRMSMNPVLKQCAAGLAAGLALLAGSVCADTTINNGQTVTVNEPATFFPSAGTIMIYNGGTLYIVPNAQSAPRQVTQSTTPSCWRAMPAP